jgi:hypothetical protein
MDELSEDGIEGAFLERAIQQIAYQETKNQSNFYPIIVVLSDTISTSVFQINYHIGVLLFQKELISCC